MEKLILLICSVFVAFNSSADDLDDAVTAYYQKNYDTAFSILKPMAEKGDSRSQLWLAHLYTYSESDKYLDVAKGLDWYSKAAEQGNAEAEYQTAYILSHARSFASERVSRSEMLSKWKEALKNFQAAADQGHAGAQLMLGHMNYDALGVQRDFVSAYMWYLIAQNRLNQGQSEDRLYISAWLDATSRILTKEERSEAQTKAVQWEKSHPDAIKKWPIGDCPYKNCSNPYTFDGEVLKLLNNYYKPPPLESKSVNVRPIIWVFAGAFLFIIVLIIIIRNRKKRQLN